MLSFPQYTVARRPPTTNLNVKGRIMIEDYDGTKGSVMAAVEDGTALKRADGALCENMERYRQLFQSAPIALIERDASQLKFYLEKLRASGISDFEGYAVL